LEYFDKIFSIFGPSRPDNLVSRVALNLFFASLTITERNLAFRYFAFILHI